MKLVNTLISLLPAPLFYTGAVVSAFAPSSICTASWFGVWEMPLMWLVMGLAHTGNWIMWWERRRYVRYQTLPDKQQ